MAQSLQLNDKKKAKRSRDEKGTIMQNYGAAIERGIIAEACGGGYKVQSFTRDGIVTPAIPSVSGAPLKVGDRVYFFVFDDGHGAILAAF